MQGGRQAGSGRPGADLDLEGRGTTLLRRLAPFLVTVAAACGQLAGASPAHAQHPNVARGFSPAGMLDVGGLDRVSGFNGNLTIRIPFRSYPVGGLMGSYSFALAYNSNVWSHAEVDNGDGTTSTLAISDPVANAGLGWSFSLGRVATDFGISGFEGPADGSQLTYFAPDGGQHALLGASGDAAWFSQDGSFLRYLKATQSVEFPDGMQHFFDGNGYPTTILDRFNNGLSITYVPCAAPNTDLICEWDIQDNWNRIHRVYFRQTGYGVNEQRTVVDHIDFQGSGDTPSTYRFQYNDEDSTGFQEVHMIGAGTSGVYPWNPRVYLLTKLTLPDGSSYGMHIADYQGQTSDPTGNPGPINKLRLPTSGSVAWTYQTTQLPQPSTSKPWLNAIWTRVLGVHVRTLSDTGAACLGQWTYTESYDTVNRTPEVVRQVSFPSADPHSACGTPGHSEVTYYSGCVHATCTGTGGGADTYAVDYGLPFSRLQAGDGAGRFLSQQVYEQGATAPIRSVYVNYENDGNPLQGDEPVFANQRLQSSRTYFRDDALATATSAVCATQVSSCRSSGTDSTDYDGLGHYRQQTTSDTFGMGTPRIERIEWNQFLPGPPANNQPWLLDTFTYQQQQEGLASERQEAVFDPAKGFLQCWRRLKSGTTRGIHDVVVNYDRDPATGNVLVEKWFGGDTGTVSTAASSCPGGGDSPAYTYNHLYSGGIRSSTTVQVTSGNTTYPLSLLNLTVDKAGLTSVSTDPSGRPTSFTYDGLGRVLTSSPRGDATTTLSYALSDTAPPRLTRVAGAGLEQQGWLLDGIGRAVQETVTLPDGTVAPKTFAYNALGSTTFVSETASAAGTNILGYDAFGRPSTIQPAVGKPTTIGYTGGRIASRTEWVLQQKQQTGANGQPVRVTAEFAAVTRETYDGLGRLIQVQDPNGTITHYHYDVGGRLDSVLSATASGSQVRSFKYDGRGFLVREVNPEAAGAASYRYDPLGNVTQRSTGTGTVFSSYDAAGRAVGVSVPLGNSTVQLKNLVYDTAANGVGKLGTAHAYNYRSADSCATPYEVRQDLSYDPNHGRLSQEVTQLLHGSVLEQWTQSYVYDGAGRITQTSYPSCQAPCSAPSRTVTTNYTYGRPTSVPGYASAISYNHNGTLAAITHQNHVVFVETPDPTGMMRPSSLGVLSGIQGGSNPWQPEAYSYDSTGNITQIGSKGFTYDAKSRLFSAALPIAAPQPYREHSYDAFGNLTQIASGTGPGNTPTSTSYDTDAMNHLLGGTYDNAGSLKAFQGSTYLWDPLQRLTDVSTGSEVWVHIYDALGERVWSWRTSSTRIDNYALRGQDGKVLSLFTKVSGAYTWEDYVYREGQALAAQFSDGSVHHLDVDHLGSVRLETDGNGGVLYYRDYWPYGEEATTPASSERMSFSGQERDLGILTSTADDIDYMHARYYRPLFGRFLTVDLSRGDPRRPDSWNRYSYVTSNPLAFVDPFGLDLVCTTSKPDSETCTDDITVIDGTQPPPPPPPPDLSGDFDFFSQAGGQFSQPDTSLSRALPDFYSANLSIAIVNPFTLSLVGLSGTLSVDKYGKVYWSPLAGAQVGKSPGIVGFSVTANWLNQLSNPTASQLSGFLSGLGFNFTAGAGPAISESWVPTGGWGTFATGVGWATPQIGISGNYSWPIQSSGNVINPIHW
jgi:RHS repeat-associated protein